MKVVIFPHFFEIVEKRFNYKQVDKLLLKTTACLFSKNKYSLVSDNSLTGIVSLCIHFKSSTISAPDYLRTFDEYLCYAFSKTYHDCIEKNDGVRLPNFTVSRIDNSAMNDTSFRKTASIAHGLIESFTGYAINNTSITQKSLKRNDGLVKFVITRQ